MMTGGSAQIGYWPRHESPAESANLSDPGRAGAEIAEDVESLGQLARVAADLRLNPGASELAEAQRPVGE